jgi:hypothetical protein
MCLGGGHAKGEKNVYRRVQAGSGELGRWNDGFTCPDSHQRAFALEPTPCEQQAGREALLAGHERHAHAWFIHLAN